MNDLNQLSSTVQNLDQVMMQNQAASRMAENVSGNLRQLSGELT